MSRDDDQGPSKRQLAKRERRQAGDRSADLARTLMKLPSTTLTKLPLDEDLRTTIDRARAIPSDGARRRAERALAGDLRRIDLGELATAIANVQATGSAEPQLFHLAERWRERLITEPNAVAEFPGGAGEELPRLIAKARSERDTGRPPGAKRALFRHVMAVLKATASPPIAADDE